MYADAAARWGIACLALAVAIPSTTAAADLRPVVLVLESEQAGIEAATVRAAVGEQLGVPVVPLIDAPEPIAGIVVVAVSASGSVRIEYRRRALGGGSIEAELPRGRRRDQMAWIAQHAATVVRDVEARYGALRATEVIDPWLDQRTRVAASGTRVVTSEVIDPFSDVPLETPRIVTAEVLDPWNPAAADRPSPLHDITRDRAGASRGAALETGAGLAAPRPGGRR